MFSKDEAIAFLEKKWKMENVKKQLQTDRKQLLNKIIVLIQENVPFNTLFLRILTPIPPIKRLALIPTLDDIEKCGITGNGGNCTVVNVFTYRLLKVLGYSVYICHAAVTSVEFNPHLIIVVKDLEKEGDLHLVDCGLGLPSFRAISLNFLEESPVYHDSFLEYKFIRRGNRFLRMHGRGDLLDHNKKSLEPGLDFYIGKWRRFYHFAIEMIECVTLADLGPLFSFMYLRRDLVTARAVRFPGGKAIIIMGDKLLLERNDRTLEVITMVSKEEILKAYREYFPMIDENIVHQADVSDSRPSSKL